MIAMAQVMIALRPWLGVRLSRAVEPLTPEIAGLLNGYSPHQGPEELRARLDSLLFRSVREATRGTMLAQLEDESWVRIRVEDFSLMADDLLLLVFLDWPVDARHLQLLRDYSMRQSSLAALRALYTRFSPLQTRDELRAIAAVIRSCYPAGRWRSWLDQ